MIGVIDSKTQLIFEFIIVSVNNSNNSLLHSSNINSSFVNNSMNIR